MSADKRLLSQEELQQCYDFITDGKYGDLNVPSANKIRDHIAALEEQADHDIAWYMDALAGSRKRIDKLEAHIAAVRALCVYPYDYMTIEQKLILAALESPSELRSHERVDSRSNDRVEKQGE
jgi:hypothetical protein